MSPSETSELLCAFPSGKVEQAIRGDKINPIILGSNIISFVLNLLCDIIKTTPPTPQLVPFILWSKHQHYMYVYVRVYSWCNNFSFLPLALKTIGTCRSESGYSTICYWYPIFEWQYYMQFTEIKLGTQKVSFGFFTSKYLQTFPIQLTFLQFASMLFLAEDFCLWACGKIKDGLE